MKKYIGTKMIEATPMSRGEYNRYRGWTIPKDENPADEGYLVKYSDGYESWSPKKQFEEVYRGCDNMTFGLAIEMMKKGKKVARKGWNGKGMFLYMQGGSKVAFHDLKEDVQRKLMNKHGVDDSGKVTINPHIDMKASDGSVVIGWLASQTDMLAEDWIVVE